VQGLASPLGVSGNSLVFDTVSNRAYYLDSGLERVAWTYRDSPNLVRAV
jgi:hypothetical protein